MSAINAWLKSPPSWGQFSRGAIIVAFIVGIDGGYAIATSAWEDIRLYVGILGGLGVAAAILSAGKHYRD